MTPNERRSRLSRFLISYGAGFKHLQPVTEWKHFNTFCWIVVIVGVVGWTIDLVVYYFFWPI